MFRSLARLLRFELAKAARSRLIWVVTLVPAFWCLPVLGWEAIAGRFQLSGTSAGGSPASAFRLFARAAGDGMTLGGMLLMLTASLMVAQEGSWRTFRTVLTRPHRPATWLLAKFLTLLALAGAIIGGVSLVALAGAGAMADFTGVVEEGWEFYSRGEMIHHAWLAVGLTAPPLVTLAALGTLCSTLTDHPGLAAGGGFATFIALETAKAALEADQRRFLFNAFTPSVLDTSYFAVLGGYAEGLSDAGWPSEMILYNIVSPSAWTLLFLGVAFVIFTRREFPA